jgi:hypothetical protein
MRKHQMAKKMATGRRGYLWKKHNSYKCSMCPERGPFKTNGDLTAHLIAIHSGKDLYENGYEIDHLLFTHCLNDKYRDYE